MTPDVARFLLGLLGAQNLSAGADDLESVVAQVLAARAALLEIVKESVDA